MTYVPAFCDSCGAPATRPGGDAGTGPHSIHHRDDCPEVATGPPPSTWTPETITAFESDRYQCWDCNAVHLVKTGCPRAPRTTVARSMRRLTRPPSPETERWHDALSDLGAV